uniref:ANK_REP_REGION domain-containing protein n=1 Tax=Macrostomum lignano TaxID=282301 RepID=A0A1I8F9N6_9PLAT
HYLRLGRSWLPGAVRSGAAGSTFISGRPGARRSSRALGAGDSFRLARLPARLRWPPWSEAVGCAASRRANVRRHVAGHARTTTASIGTIEDDSRVTLPSSAAAGLPQTAACLGCRTAFLSLPGSRPRMSTANAAAVVPRATAAIAISTAKIMTSSASRWTFLLRAADRHFRVPWRGNFTFSNAFASRRESWQGVVPTTFDASEQSLKKTAKDWAAPWRRTPVSEAQEARAAPEARELLLLWLVHRRRQIESRRRTGTVMCTTTASCRERRSDYYDCCVADLHVRGEMIRLGYRHEAAAAGHCADKFATLLQKELPFQLVIAASPCFGLLITAFNIAFFSQSRCSRRPNSIPAEHRVTTLSKVLIFLCCSLQPSSGPSSYAAQRLCLANCRHVPDDASPSGEIPAACSLYYCILSPPHTSVRWPASLGCCCSPSANSAALAPRAIWEVDAMSTGSSVAKNETPTNVITRALFSRLRLDDPIGTDQSSDAAADPFKSIFHIVLAQKRLPLAADGGS